MQNRGSGKLNKVRWITENTLWIYATAGGDLVYTPAYGQATLLKSVRDRCTYIGQDDNLAVDMHRLHRLCCWQLGGP